MKMAPSLGNIQYLTKMELNFQYFSVITCRLGGVEARGRLLAPKMVDFPLSASLAQRKQKIHTDSRPKGGHLCIFYFL